VTDIFVVEIPEDHASSNPVPTFQSPEPFPSACARHSWTRSIGGPTASLPSDCVPQIVEDWENALDSRNEYPARASTPTFKAEPELTGLWNLGSFLAALPSVLLPAPHLHPPSTALKGPIELESYDGTGVTPGEPMKNLLMSRELARRSWRVSTCCPRMDGDDVEQREFVASSNQ